MNKQEFLDLMDLNLKTFKDTCPIPDNEQAKQVISAVELFVSNMKEVLEKLE